ncbi:hypothetical protein JOD31_000857 [Methylopila capsulata]|uniref:Transposase n=1 Tax=Methylopila capsulata TaxID=61654 RepID=A0ABS2T5J1_9HYPH|nr:hypothetical protein [Methylopila capsulata]MBM7850645.1 hypothetical protein [Methylopila capsulata]
MLLHAEAATEAEMSAGHAHRAAETGLRGADELNGVAAARERRIARQAGPKLHQLALDLLPVTFDPIRVHQGISAAEMV